MPYHRELSVLKSLIHTNLGCAKHRVPFGWLCRTVRSRQHQRCRSTAPWTSSRDDLWRVDRWRQVQHGAHRHGTATTFANTAHGQHQPAVQLGLLFCKWKWADQISLTIKTIAAFNISLIYTTSARYITVRTIVLYIAVLYWQSLVLSAPAVSSN